MVRRTGITRNHRQDRTAARVGGRSRRGLLADAAGAVGLLAGETFLGGRPAQAGTDGEVVLGVVNIASADTVIDTSASAAMTGTDFGDGPAVLGVAAGSGAALFGVAANGTEGLYAQSDPQKGTFPGFNSTGVHGVTNSSTSAAVWAENVGGGDGVLGTTSKGAAVLGHATAKSGIGVAAENTGGGTALKVEGPAVFTRSGKAAIRFPHTSAEVMVPGGLSVSALILAVMQNSVPRVWVAAAVPDTKAGRVRLHLNKAPGRAGKAMTAHVAWFVVN